MHQCPGFIITGTDTDVGKTYVTQIIAKQFVKKEINIGLYKPACSGSELREDNKIKEGQKFLWNDVELLFNAIDGQYDRSRICPQCFHAPVAPPVAAHLENKTVDSDLIYSGLKWWQDKVDLLLVEGVGGLLCPLSQEENIADFALKTGYPVIIVARLGLGTINHTLLTIEAAQSRGLKIAGIILNDTEQTISDISRKTNPEEIQKRTTIPLLGIVHYQGNQIISVEGNTPANIDWFKL